MSEPDRRIRDLLAMLTDSGLGWIVVELLDGIQNGLLVEERSADLENAREKVQLGLGETAPELRHELPPSRVHLEGTRQVEWAIQYLVRRLNDGLEMVQASQDQLDFLAVSDRSPVVRMPGIRLRMGEDEPILEKVSLAESREHIASLTAALEAWGRQEGNR